MESITVVFQWLKRCDYLLIKAAKAENGIASPLFLERGTLTLQEQQELGQSELWIRYKAKNCKNRET